MHEVVPYVAVGSVCVPRSAYAIGLWIRVSMTSFLTSRSVLEVLEGRDAGGLIKIAQGRRGEGVGGVGGVPKGGGQMPMYQCLSVQATGYRCLSLRLSWSLSDEVQGQ